MIPGELSYQGREQLQLIAVNNCLEFQREIVHFVWMGLLTLFVYLSGACHGASAGDNNNTNLHLYFDDFKITHQESPVIQVNNYYPFGMVSNTWLREGEINNATCSRVKS